jgi:hypothetical protein
MSHLTTELSRCEARGRAVGSNDLFYTSERLFVNPCLAYCQASPVLLALMQIYLIRDARQARLRVVERFLDTISLTIVSRFASELDILLRIPISITV